MMDDDHIKRFSLSEKQPHRAFRQNADAPLVKTKDNAQPVIPPPRTVFLPHPRLAPPGMMGSRIAADAAKWKERCQREAQERSEFKSSPPKARPRSQFKIEDLSFRPRARSQGRDDIER